MDSSPWVLLFLYFMAMFLFFLTFIFFLKEEKKNIKKKEKWLSMKYWMNW